MHPPQQTTVRGTCLCGRRYRIRNAHAGAIVSCPACRRVIQVTEADLRMAASDERLIPIQDAGGPLLEAELIDRGELRLAGGDARPGLTDRYADEHEEVLLARALRGRGSLEPVASPTRRTRLAAILEGPEAPIAPRRFAADLLASFYFAGSRQNALNVLLSAAACSLCTVLLLAVLPPGPFVLLGAIAYVLIAAYMMQFYWSVLRETAGGEDVIPWVASDWDLWDDCVKPALWLLAIGAACSLPAAAVLWLAPPRAPWLDTAFWAALLGGWFFWPAAVMSVALGETILFARPDWLLRCVAGIGPAYLLAWALVMLLLAGWWLLYRTAAVIAIAPLVGPLANLYIGYVLFRTLGLLFRHFRGRLPWRF